MNHHFFRNVFFSLVVIGSINGSAAQVINLRGQGENSAGYRQWYRATAEERAEKHRQWERWVTSRSQPGMTLPPGAYRGSQDSKTGPINMLPPGMKPSTPQPEFTAKTCAISLDQYRSLQTNMSYGQAAQALGCDGDPISSSEVAGYATMMFAWRGAGAGANMNATFQNDRLIGKAQFGLR